MINLDYLKFWGNIYFKGIIFKITHPPTGTSIKSNGRFIGINFNILIKKHGRKKKE